MNTPPSGSLVEALVRAELGDNVHVESYEPPIGSWMQRAISSASKWLGYEVRIYAAATPLAELFCLDSERAPTVVVSGGYLSTLGKFRRVMFDPMPGDLRGDLLSQLFLEASALHCLRSGDPDLGAVVLQHTLRTRSLIIDVPHHFRPQSDPIDGSASVFVDGIFSILHEIGHTNRDLGSVLIQFSGISDSSLLRWIEKYLDDIAWMTTDIRKFVIEQATQSNRHFLGLSNLRREIYADLFAAQQLLMVGKEAAESEGHEFDVIAFWAALYREFNSINVMQRTRFLARTSTDYPVAREHLLDYMSYPVAMAVRSSFLALGLLSFAKGQTVLSEEDLSSRWFEEMSPQAIPEIGQCDVAIDVATDVWLGASMSDAYVKMTQILPVVGRSIYARSDLKSYLSTAHTLGIDSTYLGLLRRLVDGDGLATAETDFDESDTKVAVSFLVAMSPEFEQPRLIYVPLEGEAPAIVAFTDSRDALQFAKDLDNRYLRPGESIDFLHESFDHPQELESFVEENFGESTLLIQGTIAYGNFMSAAALKLGSKGAKKRVNERTRDAMADRYALYNKATSDPVTLSQFTDIVRLIEDI